MDTKPPFTIIAIDHLGLAPRDPRQALKFFTIILGLSSLGSEAVASEGVNVAMVASHHTPASTPMGPTPFPLHKLELLEAQSSTSPIASFVEKKGGGIHHIAFRVDNIRAAAAYLKQQGVLLINNEPRAGAHGSEILFVHPKSTGGILVELVAQRQPT